MYNLAIITYTHSQAMALFHYHDTDTVCNQHQLLMIKTSKWHLYHFQKLLLLNYHQT